MHSKLINLKTIVILLVCLLVVLVGCVHNQPSVYDDSVYDAVVSPIPQATVSAEDATIQVVFAAEALLDILDESQRSTLLFDFDDNDQRERWSNLPTGIVERSGLRMGDLSQSERDAVFGVLAATLSPQGYQQVMENISGDQVLRESEDEDRDIFGEDEYYFSILGIPSTSEPWMWQFGGHHLAINATIVGGNIVLTPSLTGGQPIQYTRDGRKVYQLKSEYDKSFEMINALDSQQQEEAILGNNPINLLLGPGEDGKRLQPEGIKASLMTSQQQQLLLELIGERVNLLNAEDAAVKMAEVKANLSETWFAWYGPTTKGSAAYYRIQGPTVIIEYAPQDMDGSAVDHTHAIYRDPTNDYGAGLLR